MITIHFKQHNNECIDVTAEPGDNLMEVARDNDIEGVSAECGGACACATCHCIPGQEWQPLLPGKSDNETMILEGAFNVEDGSRLACQITVSEEMDGMQVTIPEGLI